jgi:hypothetical protein
MADKKPAAWGAGVLAIVLVGWLIRTVIVSSQLAEEQGQREQEMTGRIRNEMKGFQAQVNLMNHEYAATTQADTDTQPTTRP